MDYFKENHKIPRFQRESNIFQGVSNILQAGDPTFSMGV